MQAVRFGVGDSLQDKCWKGGLRGIGDFIASSWAGIGYATAGVHSCEGCSMPASHCTTRLGGLRDHVLSATSLNLSLVISKPCGTKSTCHRAGQPLSTLSTQPLPPQCGCVTAMVWRKVCRVAAWLYRDITAQHPTWLRLGSLDLSRRGWHLCHPAVTARLTVLELDPLESAVFDACVALE